MLSSHKPFGFGFFVWYFRLIDEQQIEKYEKANDFKNPGQMFSLSRYNTFEEVRIQLLSYRA